MTNAGCHKYKSFSKVMFGKLIPGKDCEIPPNSVPIVANFPGKKMIASNVGIINATNRTGTRGKKRGIKMTMRIPMSPIKTLYKLIDDKFWRIWSIVSWKYSFLSKPANTRHPSICPEKMMIAIHDLDPIVTDRGIYLIKLPR